MTINLDERVWNDVSDEIRDVARQLMESFFLSRRREKMLHHRGAINHKPGEVMVLYSIGVNNDERGMMVSEISEKLNVTSPTVTQHIKSLEAQGLIERLYDPSDRRIVRVRLSGKGEKYLQRINEARLEMFIGLANHLGVERSLLFAELLKDASEYMLNQVNHLMADGVDRNE